MWRITDVSSKHVSEMRLRLKTDAECNIYNCAPRLAEKTLSPLYAPHRKILVRGHPHTRTKPRGEMRAAQTRLAREICQRDRLSQSQADVLIDTGQPPFRERCVASRRGAVI
jgi:hypothetical protein